MLVCCARKDGRIRVYSLCVAGGPRHPLGLLQYDDGSRYVIRRALDLVRRQSQELRSAVREFQRQIRAAGMVTVGATSHHTSHKIGHRWFHPREHDPAWVQATRLREFTPAGQTPARRRSFAAWEADTRRPWILIQLSSPSVNTEIKDPYKQAESAARWSCDKPVAAGGFGPTGIARGAAYRSQCSRSLAGNPRVRIASWARCCHRRADPRSEERALIYTVARLQIRLSPIIQEYNVEVFIIALTGHAMLVLPAQATAACGNIYCKIQH